jgi:hypothetical protein
MTLHDYHPPHDKVNATNTALPHANPPVARLIVGVALPICYPLRTDDAATEIPSDKGSN